MGIFKKIKKTFKKAAKKFINVTTIIPGKFVLKQTTKPFRKAIGAAFKAIIPKVPKIPGVPDPASPPTFASAGGPAARAGFTGAALGPSLISSGGTLGVPKRAKTKRRTLIGGA